MSILRGVVMMKYAWSVAVVALVGLSVMAFEDAKEEKCDNASFVKKASCGNLSEIKMAKIAEKHASNSEVKAFAEKMVTEHTAAQEELKEACKTSKTECPDQMTKEGKEACEKCQKLTGEKNFDAVYISTQIECHEKALSLYEKGAKECECEKLKAYAEKHIPTIREHLAIAKKIKNDLDGKTSR
jgi:putative membrane protein